MAEYIPGVCNIGPAEIANRRMIGIQWGIGTIILLAIMVLLHVYPLMRLLIVLPAIVAFSGFYQAKFHFCAGYGNSGLYNVSKSVGKYDTVEQAEFRVKDKKKAQQIFSLSIVSAIIVSLLTLIIPG